MGETPRTSYLKIKYNNSDKTDDISNLFQSATYVDSADGEGDTFSLKVYNKDLIWLTDYYPCEDDVIEPSICLRNWIFQNDNRDVVCGRFLIDEIAINGNTSKELVNIKGISIPVDSDSYNTPKSRMWEKSTLKTILTDLSVPAGMNLFYDAVDLEVENVEQKEQTDISFAYSLCQKYNRNMKIYSNTLVVYDISLYEAKAPAHRLFRKDIDNINGTIAVKPKHDGVLIEYIPPDSDERKYYSYKLKENASRLLKISEQFNTYAEAELMAKTKLAQELRSENGLTISVKGDNQYFSTQILTIEEYGKLSGNYFIDSVSHSLQSDGKYECTMKIHRVMQDVMAMGIAESNILDEKVSDADTFIYETYEVKLHDTLIKIAKKQLGDSSRYMEIYNANRDIIKDPNLIYPGSVLKIPAK